MYNGGCQPATFTQSFSNVDPGLISLPDVLPGFDPTILATSGLTASASSLGPFAINQACAAACAASPSETAPSLSCMLKERHAQCD